MSRLWDSYLLQTRERERTALRAKHRVTGVAAALARKLRLSETVRAWKIRLVAEEAAKKRL